MNIRIYVIVGVVLCLGSIRPALLLATEQANTGGNNPDTLKSPKKDSKRQGSTVRIRFAEVDNRGTVLNQADKNKKSLSSGGDAQAGLGRATGKVYVATNTGVFNEKDKTKKLSSGGDPKPQTGTDGQNRVLVGNDQGVWRSGKNNQKKVEKKKETSTTTTSAGGSQASGTAQPATTIQTTSSGLGSQSSGTAQPATTIQTTTSVGGSQSLGSPQPTIPLGGQTGAPALNTNSQTLGGLLQISPSPTP